MAPLRAAGAVPEQARAPRRQGHQQLRVKAHDYCFESLLLAGRALYSGNLRVATEGSVNASNYSTEPRRLGGTTAAVILCMLKGSNRQLTSWPGKLDAVRPWGA